MDESARTKPEVSSPAVEPDEALRVAIKAALDAGDLERAGRLLDVLKGSRGAPAVVVDLDAKRRERGA